MGRTIVKEVDKQIMTLVKRVQMVNLWLDTAKNSRNGAMIGSTPASCPSFGLSERNSYYDGVMKLSLLRTSKMLWLVAASALTA